MEINCYKNSRMFDMTTTALLFGARAESKQVPAEINRFEVNVLIIGVSSLMGENYAQGLLRGDLPRNIQAINPLTFHPTSLQNQLAITIEQYMVFNGHVVLMPELEHVNDGFIYEVARSLLDIEKHNTQLMRTVDESPTLCPTLFVHCQGEGLERRVRRAMYEIWLETYLRTNGDHVFNHDPFQYVRSPLAENNFLRELPDGCRSIGYYHFENIRGVLNGTSVIEKPKDSCYWVVIEPSLSDMCLIKLDRLFTQLRNADCTLIFNQEFLESMYLNLSVRKPVIRLRDPSIQAKESHVTTIEKVLGIE